MMPTDTRRELVGCELLTEFGLTFLVLTTRHESHVRKDGEVRYKDKVEKYRLEERVDDVFTLTKGSGEEYETTRYACTCRDAVYRGRRVRCKHRAGLVKVGLLAGAVAASTRGGIEGHA